MVARKIVSAFILSAIWPQTRFYIFFLWSKTCSSSKYQERYLILNTDKQTNKWTTPPTPNKTSQNWNNIFIWSHTSDILPESSSSTYSIKGSFEFIYTLIGILTFFNSEKKVIIEKEFTSSANGNVFPRYSSSWVLDWGPLKLSAEACDK